MKRLLLSLIALFLLQASCLAAESARAADPDPAANPALAQIQKEGGKFYYLGRRMGIDGWLIVHGDQFQIAYQTPDNKGVLIGVLFGKDAASVTATQIEELKKNNKEVADLIAAAHKEATASAPDAPAAGAPDTPPDNAIASLGDRLLHDLSAAQAVVAGKTPSPELLMVMNPDSPHSRATWAALRGAVLKGDLHIRLIPVGDAGSGSERVAAAFLGASDPLGAWDKYAGGDQGALAGNPPDAALRRARANRDIIDNWNISVLPYLVYRAGDGKIKIVTGAPGNIPALLADMGS